MDLVDNYEHNDASVMYITENIPCLGTEELFEEEFCKGCNCVTSCTQELNCTCLQNNGVNYIKKSDQEIASEKYILSNWNQPLYECNKYCKCAQDCSNKLIQFGPRRFLKIFETPLVNNANKGLGLLTTNYIPPSAFICEYAGELITEKEATRRYKEIAENSFMNYIFCLKENYGGNLIKHFIDPTKFGNIGRYINHSCDPNCNLVPIRVNNNVPRLCIFSIKDIPANSELTFDYGTEEISEDAAMKKICLCMSKNCRKFMPFCNEI